MSELVPYDPSSPASRNALSAGERLPERSQMPLMFLMVYPVNVYRGKERAGGFIARMSRDIIQAEMAPVLGETFRDEGTFMGMPCYREFNSGVRHWEMNMLHGSFIEAWGETPAEAVAAAAQYLEDNP